MGVCAGTVPESREGAGSGGQRCSALVSHLLVHRDGVLIAGRLFSFVFSVATPYMLDSMGYGLFLFYAVFDVVMLVFCWFAFKETRNKTLEVIFTAATSLQCISFTDQSNSAWIKNSKGRNISQIQSLEALATKTGPGSQKLSRRRSRRTRKANHEDTKRDTHILEQKFQNCSRCGCVFSREDRAIEVDSSAIGSLTGIIKRWARSLSEAQS